jgi:probable HAF family extracellular repeat protein
MKAINPMETTAHKVIRLTSAECGAGTYGADVSLSGQIVGTGRFGGILWNRGRDGKFVGNALLAGNGSSCAAAINGVNTVVGKAGYGAENDVRATAWFYRRGVGYVATDLGSLHGSGGHSAALGVSDSGQIVGYSCPADGGQSSAFAATVRNGEVTMVDLNQYMPRGLCAFAAWDANTSGQIAVVGGRCGGPYRTDAILMKVTREGSCVVKLPSLGGAARAEGINERGQVVGCAAVDCLNNVRAVLWNTGRSGTSIVDLGTLGGANSAAMDVNLSGEVVGWSETRGGGRSAFLWSPRLRRMIDLNALLPRGCGFRLRCANGINDAGEIVCRAKGENGMDHTVLLRPVGVRGGMREEEGVMA